MSPYRCPLCKNTMARDLALYLNHTQQHVIDQIKREHPEWVEADGICSPCAEYFKKQMGGESGESNIGPKGQKSRFAMGLAALFLGFSLAAFLLFSGAARPWYVILFLPFSGGALGLIQARRKTCALLAEFGTRNMDAGEGSVQDPLVAAELKARGRRILVQSALWGIALTLVFLFFLWQN